MSGIAFIVPNADFSGSVLGQVTIQKTVEEMASTVVKAYTDKIGSTQYSSQLTNMVLSLMREEIWNGIDIYPMLGSTLNHMAININPNNGFQGLDLKFGTNASYVTNGVEFAEGDDYGSTITDVTYKRYDGTAAEVTQYLNGFYMLSDLRRYSLNGRIRTFYTTRGNQNTPITIKIGSTGKANWEISNTSLSSTTLVGTSRNIVSFSINNGTMITYINGVQDVSTELGYASDSPNPRIGNFLGASPVNDAAVNTFNGSCWFWVIGIIDPSKHATATTIFKTFLDEVKPNI